jgi:hypothetical protein
MLALLGYGQKGRKCNFRYNSPRNAERANYDLDEGIAIANSIPRNSSVYIAVAKTVSTF